MLQCLLVLILLVSLGVAGSYASQVDTFLKGVQAGGPVMAGISKVDATMPVGVPLAGYNNGARRVPSWPKPQKTPYTAYMTPSNGVMAPTWAKALILQDMNGEKFVFVTFDGIGADNTLNKKAYTIALQQGFNIPFDRIIFSASHSHSCTGAVTPERLWEMAPATDLFVDAAQEELASSLAAALVQASLNMQAVRFGMGSGNLYNVTRNRRAKESPYLTEYDIDPQVGIFRVDDLSGKPLVTLWNFAIHGTCYGTDNLLQSGDIMGLANTLIEEQTGGIAMFVNSDAGDISPGNGMCNPKPSMLGSQKIATFVSQLRASVPVTTNQLSFTTYSRIANFGPTSMNATLERFANCSSGGPLDICTICKTLGCDINLHLGPGWVEDTPRFTALHIKFMGQNFGIVTVPGEALSGLGKEIYADAAQLGYSTTMIFGYSNSHMGYFATGQEYDVGGYESQLTFWGYNTAEYIRTNATYVLAQIKP